MPAHEPRLVSVTGDTVPAFEPVRDIFARLIADQGTGGAALAVFQHGNPVVDLVGGDYQPDSVQLLFSSSKPISAIAMAHAVQAGLIDPDEPFAAHWPEFGKSSTATVTPNMVLAHRAGLPAFESDLTIEELLDGAADRAVEQQEPYWEPGTTHGYHSFTFGLLLDGLVRRALGMNLGEYVAAHLAGPLGLDLWLGIPEHELPRVHPTEMAAQWTTPLRAELASRSVIPPGMSARLRGRGDFVNDPRMLTACWPSFSGTATARSLARLLAAVLGPVDGSRILTEQAATMLAAERSRGLDRVLGIETAFGSGVQRPFPQLLLLGPASWGHEGANGTMCVADPATGVALAFTTSVFPPVNGASARAVALLPAIRMLAER